MYHHRQSSPFVNWDDNKIAQQRVLILGSGGIGSGCAMLLARLGVARLTLVDMDCVDPTNLTRQVLFSKADVGQRKVDSAVAGLKFHCTRTEVVGVHVDALEGWHTTMSQRELQLSFIKYQSSKQVVSLTR